MAFNRQKAKSRRIELGLTLEQVADALGVKKPTIQRYESGVIKSVDAVQIEKLAKVLKCTPAYLMDWDEKDEPANKDRLIAEIDDLFVKLSPDKQKQVLDFLYFLHGQSNNL